MFPPPVHPDSGVGKPRVRTMAEKKSNPFAGGQSSKSTGSGGSRSGPSIDMSVPNNQVIDSIIRIMSVSNGVMEVPLRNDNAWTVEESLESVENEDVIRALEDMSEDVTYLSAEDIMSIDFDGSEIEYVGTPTLIKINHVSEVEDLVGTEEEVADGEHDAVLTEEDFERYQNDDLFSHGNKENGLKKYIPHPDMLEILHEGNYKKNLISDMNQLLTSQTSQYVNETHGGEEPVRLVVKKGRPYNSETEQERLTNVAFTLEEGGAVAKRIVNSLNLSDETVDAWDNGELTLEDVWEAAG